MPVVVGIRFKKACKIYYFDPADTGVVKGDNAIVETARGVEYGQVVIGPREVEDAPVPAAHSRTFAPSGTRDTA